MTTDIYPQYLPTGSLLHNNTYRIDKYLGSGGFGNTYLVTKVSFDETFAMKEFFMKDINLRSDETVSVNSPLNESTFESQKRKFAREARRLHDINHRHIVHVEDFFEENGTAYYVMAFIDGESLSEHAARTCKPFSEAETIRIARQMAEALQFIHGKRMLHLDIKPSNIMIDKAGEATLIDFGASKQFASGESTSVSSSTLEFSHSYAPGELLSGNKDSLGPWTDFYSLGATLFNMRTLRKPPSYQEVVNDGSSAFNYPYPVSNKMKSLIAKMMQPKKTSRPQTAKEVIDMLQQLDSRSKSKTAGWIWMALAAVVVAFLVGVGSFYLGRHFNAEQPATADTGETGNANGHSPVVSPKKTDSPEKDRKGKDKVVEQQTKDVKEKAQHTAGAAKEETPSTKRNANAVDLGSAVWQGPVVQGQPHGYGTMTFKQSHIVDSRDLGRHVAEKGDRLEGEYRHGHLSYGTLVRANGGEQIPIDIGE